MAADAHPRKLSAWTRLAKSVVASGRWPGDAGSAEDEAAYWAEQERTVVQYGRSLLVMLALLDFLWWPTDLPAFGSGSPVLHAFFVSRGWAVVSTLLLFVLMPRVGAIRSHPVISVTLQVMTVAFVVGYEFGDQAGRGAPWFHYTPYILLAPTTLPYRPLQRALATWWLAFALMAGFFLMHLANLRDLRTWTALCFILGVSVFSMLAGVFTDGMRRRIYTLQRATERQAFQLKDLNEHLEVRVQEQTAQVRQLAINLETARESERAHIARELHDELGQDLAAIRYALKFARIRYAQDSSAIGTYLDDLEQLLERTTTTTRSILSSLRPTVVDDLGLSAAAEWMIKRMRERTGIECDLDMPSEDLKLPKPVAATAYRILQEALTNVVRHAQAKHVGVALRLVPGTLEISIHDDGVGFVGDAPRVGNSGVGLIGMRERVIAAGGTMHIASTPEQGTCIKAELPVTEQAQGVAA